MCSIITFRCINWIYISENDTVLDVGSNVGNLLSHFKNTGVKILGLIDNMSDFNFGTDDFTIDNNIRFTSIKMGIRNTDFETIFSLLTGARNGMILQLVYKHNNSSMYLKSNNIILI